MNTKKFQGLSIAAILSLSIVAIGVIPQAIADEDEPDFIAVLEPIEGASEKASGKAYFWITEDEELKYRIFLNKVQLGVEHHVEEETEEKGKKAWSEVHSIHVHSYFSGQHQHEHLLNIIGPQDDDDMKIAGQTVHGLWDDSDAPADPGMVDTNPISETLEQICDEESDVNVHLDTGFLRGQILKNSDACSELFP
jgi:hypothetical protein